MALPSKTNNPNSSLPNRMQDSISIPEFNERMTAIDQEAEKLALRANRIWKANNPNDKIDTGLFDKKDFINGTDLVIPKQAQELFDFDDSQKLKKAQENTEAIKENLQKQFSSNEDNTTSAEDLQKQFGVKPTKEKFSISDVKKHPILSKLKEKFGIKEEENSYVTKTINDVEIVFEYPTALTTNFAMAIATGEGVGTLDFASAYELARCAMSIVAMDNVPVSELFANISNFTYQNIPSKLRKLCGFEVMQFLQKMPDKELDNILSFYRTEIGFEEITDNEKDIVELECPSCHLTKTTTIDEDGSYSIRYCDKCGTKLIPTNTAKTDLDLPLA